jgi:hypothetical protein
MARVEIPIQAPTSYKIDELTWTAADATNDHYFDNTSGRVTLLIRNDHTVAQVVTVISVADLYGRTGDLAPSVDPTGGGASSVGVVGPLPPAAFNQRGAGDLGRVHVDITDDTALSFAAVLWPVAPNV